MLTPWSQAMSHRSAQNEESPAKRKPSSQWPRKEIKARPLIPQSGQGIPLLKWTVALPDQLSWRYPTTGQQKALSPSSLTFLFTNTPKSATDIAVKYLVLSAWIWGFFISEFWELRLCLLSYPLYLRFLTTSFLAGSWQWNLILPMSHIPACFAVLWVEVSASRWQFYTVNTPFSMLLPPVL